MPRPPKKSGLKLVRNNAPQESSQAMAEQPMIAIMPMQEGVFAWIIEQPTLPFSR